jgi:RNA recognition motif-containing protein
LQKKLFYTTLLHSYGAFGDIKAFGVLIINRTGEEKMEKKIYVGNIPFKSTEADIRELFSKSGEVESVKIIMDAQTGYPKGFGFVEMATAEDAQRAIETLNGSLFMERTLSVSEARPQQPRERRGFGEGRGGFGAKKGSFSKKRGTGRGWR